MKFEDFERLESFNVMTNKIEEARQAEKPSSLKGETSKKSGGLTVRSDGSHKRE